MTKKDIKCDFGEMQCDDKVTFCRTTHYAMVEDISDSDELVLDEECNLFEPRYITHHLASACVFFLYFVIVGILISFLHEFFTIMMFVLFGYDFSKVVITIDSGDLIASIPTDAPYWWYVLAFLGPSLFVEGVILLLLITTKKIEEKPTFLDGRRTRKIRINTLKRAMGWFCAVKMMAMILFFTIYNLIYWGLGMGETTDLIIAWNSTRYVSNSYEVLFIQISTCVIGSVLLSLSGLYLYSTSRTEIVI